MQSNKKVSTGRSVSFFRHFEDAEKAWYIWELRKEGLTYSQVAKQVGATVAEVRAVIYKCRKDLMGDVRKNTEEARALAIDRAEGIIAMYTNIAKAGKVKVSREDKGVPFTDEEWRYCLLAGKIVLEAIREVAKLEGVYNSEAPPTVNTNERVLMFLKETEPRIAQIVESQPVEVINQRGEPDFSFPRD